MTLLKNNTQASMIPDSGEGSVFLDLKELTAIHITTASDRNMAPCLHAMLFSVGVHRILRPWDLLCNARWSCSFSASGRHAPPFELGGSHPTALLAQPVSHQHQTRECGPHRHSSATVDAAPANVCNSWENAPRRTRVTRAVPGAIAMDGSQPSV